MCKKDNDSIEQLIAGYQRFRDGYYKENRQRLDDLTHQGQSPKIAIIACCDSRVDPSIITDSTPGDLFVIRNVANLVPPNEGDGKWHGTSAALEFAVSGLEVEHIIVLGHARCGGIRTLMENKNDQSKDKFISSWMSIVDEARTHALNNDDYKTLDEQAHACELNAIEISLANLLTFTCIQKRVEQKSLQLHGWYYDMASGELLRSDANSKCFVSL
ncbi:MAG: carbonic anhydrase [Woeseiaceae bacterium]